MDLHAVVRSAEKQPWSKGRIKIDSSRTSRNRAEAFPLGLPQATGASKLLFMFNVQGILSRDP